jgi:hypothetical protein
MSAWSATRTYRRDLPAAAPPAGPALIPATRAAGVEGLRFHDFRHTAATLAVAAGASTRELMVRMGHSSSAAALRYQHVMAGRDAAIAAALDELIQAASARSEGTVDGGSGTNRAARPEGPASMIGRGGRELRGCLVGLPGLNLGPHPYQRSTAEPVLSSVLPGRAAPYMAQGWGEPRRSSPAGSGRLLAAHGLPVGAQAKHPGYVRTVMPTIVQRRC